MPIHRGHLCEWSVQNNSLSCAAVPSTKCCVKTGFMLVCDIANFLYCLETRYQQSCVRRRSLSEQTDALSCRFYTNVGRNSIVGIATMRLATGWTVRGSNPRGDEIFRTRPDRPWSLPSLLYNGYRVSFPGVKRPGRGANHPPPSSVEVKG